MTDIYVGDVVVNVGDHSVTGDVLQESEADGGLHSTTKVDSWGTGTGPRSADSGLVPVRWHANDGVPYEWWEAPEFLKVIHPALDRGQRAVH